MIILSKDQMVNAERIYSARIVHGENGKDRIIIHTSGGTLESEVDSQDSYKLLFAISYIMRVKDPLAVCILEKIEKEIQTDEFKSWYNKLVVE